MLFLTETRGFIDNFLTNRTVNIKSNWIHLWLEICLHEKTKWKENFTFRLRYLGTLLSQHLQIVNVWYLHVVFGDFESGMYLQKNFMMIIPKNFWKQLF